MKLNIIILISILTFSTLSYGQFNTQIFKNQPLVVGDTVKELSKNIMVIYQDKKNNYWFGSWQDGLYKFDGKVIVHFTTKHGLPENRIEEIKEDNQGYLFISTRGGLYKYDGKRFISISETLQSISNWALQPSDLWFKSTKPGHVSRYDGKFLTNLKVPKSKIGEEYLAKHPGTFDPYGIYCIYKDGKGNIWFGTALMGAFRYNGKSFDWISEPDVTEMHDGPANGVRSIIEDGDGYFWFNTMYRYKALDSVPKNSALFYEREKSIGNLDGKKDSKLNEYLSIAMDNDNNLWLVTYENGVWKYNGNTVTHYPVKEKGKDIFLFYIYKDNNGELWLGTHENGVYKFNGTTFEKPIA